ncbi:hypothetical protein E2C01_052867 [Portunus trituberculatus]|uniref:Uncharacterized protein n=1 Tax=Portunus trituberculatus TaxID=210409 RepID=A0A5B7GNL6_PORTR|nr:hypothetical protein [Portunus trituberculatus]
MESRMSHAVTQCSQIKNTTHYYLKGQGYGDERGGHAILRVAGASLGWDVVVTARRPDVGGEVVTFPMWGT